MRLKDGVPSRRDNHSKEKTQVSGSFLGVKPCDGLLSHGETKTGVASTLVIFQDRPMILLKKKTKPRFGECSTCFECETKTGVLRILAVFQDRLTFNHITQKVSARAFH